MPSLNEYRRRMGGPMTSGQAKKYESDLIMDNTWWEDISSKVAYLYDYYHDNEPLKLKNLSPDDRKMVPVDIKFLVNAYNSENKDQVGYHIQFRPWHECPVPYYQEEFEERWDAEYPVGLYCAIPDERGIYRKWLITEPANHLGNQFPTYYVLPCDHVFQWIYDGKKYELAGVIRNQNSYNSGVWLDYKVERVENQEKCLLPMNDLSTTIFYNQRIAVSADIKEPVVWRCTKVEQIANKGVSCFTFAQDIWNSEHDYIERDEDGKLVGIWCDYYRTKLDKVPEPDPVVPISTMRAEIKYSGKRPQLKVGGSYKKFSVLFYRDDEQLPETPGYWLCFMDGTNITSQLDIEDVSTNADLTANQIRIKIPKDDSMIGKTITIIFRTNDGIEAKQDVEIVAL